MTARLARKYPEDDGALFSVTPIDWQAVEAWHKEALKLREQGLTIREIAAEVGRSYSPVQRFLNPESKRRATDWKNRREMERRHTDAAYLESGRTYRRRYIQTYLAPKEWKDVPRRSLPVRCDWCGGRFFRILASIRPENYCCRAHYRASRRRTA